MAIVLTLHQADAPLSAPALCEVPLETLEGSEAEEFFRDYLSQHVSPPGSTTSGTLHPHAEMCRPGGSDGQQLYCCAHSVAINARELPVAMQVRVYADGPDGELLAFGVAEALTPGADAKRFYAEARLRRWQLCFERDGEEAGGWELCCAALCAEAMLLPAMSQLACIIQTSRWSRYEAVHACSTLLQTLEAESAAEEEHATRASSAASTDALAPPSATPEDVSGSSRQPTLAACQAALIAALRRLATPPPLQPSVPPQPPPSLPHVLPPPSNDGVQRRLSLSTTAPSMVTSTPIANVLSARASSSAQTCAGTHERTAIHHARHPVGPTGTPPGMPLWSPDSVASAAVLATASPPQPPLHGAQPSPLANPHPNGAKPNPSDPPLPRPVPPRASVGTSSSAPAALPHQSSPSPPPLPPPPLPPPPLPSLLVPPPSHRASSSPVAAGTAAGGAAPAVAGPAAAQPAVILRPVAPHAARSSGPGGGAVSLLAADLDSSDDDDDAASSAACAPRQMASSDAAPLLAVEAPQAVRVARSLLDDDLTEDDTSQPVLPQRRIAQPLTSQPLTSPSGPQPWAAQPTALPQPLPSTSTQAAPPEPYLPRPPPPMLPFAAAPYLLPPRRRAPASVPSPAAGVHVG